MRFRTIVLACTLAAVSLVAVPTLADESEQIEEAVLNYVEGYFTSDSARMAKALHPNLFKCTVNKYPGSDDEVLKVMTAEELIAVCEINQEWVEGKSGSKSVEILYQDSRIAVVHAVSDGFYDLINLMKLNGEWKIVQVVWDRN